MPGGGVGVTGCAGACGKRGEVCGYGCAGACGERGGGGGGRDGLEVAEGWVPESFVGEVCRELGNVVDGVGNYSARWREERESLWEGFEEVKRSGVSRDGGGIGPRLTAEEITAQLHDKESRRRKEDQCSRVYHFMPQNAHAKAVRVNQNSLFGKTQCVVTEWLTFL